MFRRRLKERQQIQQLRGEFVFVALCSLLIIEMKKLTDSYSYEYSFFPAILQGDDVRAREILEVLKGRGVSDPANQLLDATADSALIGGINYGHLNIVKLLLEYGAKPNQICNIPAMRGANITYFNLAILTYDMVANNKSHEVAE